jgi:two-component system, cell cycle response regulator CpdR
MRAVLVVDDDALVLDVIAMMLEDIGYEVLTATSGKDALEKLARQPRITTLVTDINMAGLDGYELADRARRVRKGLRVVLVSGRESDTHGFLFIRKPFLPADLSRVMRQAA